VVAIADGADLMLVVVMVVLLLIIVLIALGVSWLIGRFTQ
jgi:hypothetical protein